MAIGIFGEKAVILSRVSTFEQRFKSGANPQQKALYDYAKGLGYTTFHYIDGVESGFKDLKVRESWNEVITFLDNNKDYKTILATEINRLARDETALMEIKEYLYDNGIQLIIKDLGFFLLNPDGQKTVSADIMFNIYVSMARFEMLEKRERQRRGLEEQRLQGFSQGGKELFGYNRVEKLDGRGMKRHTYEINEDEQAQIIQIYEWYAYGIEKDLTQTSLARITQECIAKGFSKYLHSKRNVNKCLKESAYIGQKITHNKKKNADYWNYDIKDAPKYIDAHSYVITYPILMDKELFDAVQERMSKQNSHKTLISNNQLVDKSSKHITILSKIITCPVCEHFLVGEYRIKNGFRKHSYRCTYSKGKMASCTHSGTYSMVNLDSALWAFLKEKVHEINKKRNEMYSAIDDAKLVTEIENLTKQLDEFDVRYRTADKIFSARASRNFDDASMEYEEKLKEIDKEKAKVMKLISIKSKTLKELRQHNEEEQHNKKIEEIIQKIGDDKSEIYKYMHLLVKSVKPLFSTKKYTAIEIIAFDNLDDVLDYKEADNNGLPKIKSEKHDNTYYICIDKHDTNRIKTRLINDNLVFWDDEKNGFYVKGSSNLFSIEEIFSINLNEQDVSNYCDLTNSIEELDYKPLDVYGEDELTIKK